MGRQPPVRIDPGLADGDHGYRDWKECFCLGRTVVIVGCLGRDDRGIVNEGESGTELFANDCLCSH